MADSRKELAKRIADYQREHPTGGNPPYEIPTRSQEKIWLCEIETDHKRVKGTSFCRCSHAMYA